MIWLRLLVLELIVCVTPGFAYYHQQSKRDFSVSLNPEANFGFSISSFSSSLKLVVGAPLADNIGNIYTCNLASNNANTCQSVDRTGIERFKYNNRYDNQSYWYGATVKGTETFFVGCSPLFIDRVIKFKGGYDIGTYGRCYKSTKPQLLKLLDKETRGKNASKLEEYMDSFGWSLDIGSDDSILVGGPAMTSGRVIKEKTTSLTNYVNGTTCKNSFNFGYSVVSGKFLSAKLSVAVGSPYGYDGHGKVSFLVDGTKGTMKLLKTLPSTTDNSNDHQVGSMFGAVLCAATLGDAPQKTDLLVGAPTYAAEGYNFGAVFVYIARKNFGLEPVFKNKIVGKMSGSYFGSAIVSVGDLNGDKKDEIAIAAPYEHNGRGTVYLYSGANLIGDGGITPVQVIEPESTLRTFGYSLTAVIDYDDNGCNELAIGVPANNKVTVFKCMAAITIELLKFESFVVKKTGDQDIIKSLPVCFKAEFPAKPVKVKAEIRVKIHIQHDGVKFTDGNADGAVTIKIEAKQEKPYCENINIILSKNGDFNKEINYYLSATLQNDPAKKPDFEGSEVTLTERSVKNLKGLIWVRECGNKLCVPNLKMQHTFSEKSPYVIGSTKSIIATVWVTNTGDVAYDACVRVKVTGAPLPQRTEMCRPVKLTDGELLECKPKQQLRQSNSPWSTEAIALDTTKLTNEDKNITVNMMLYNDCGTSVSFQNITVIQMYADADTVAVHGRTDEGVDNLVNFTRTDIATRKTFQHVYTIINHGSTNWVNIGINVKVQNKDFFDRSVSINDQQCQSKATNETENYSCAPVNLDQDAAVEVKVIMKGVPELIRERIGKENLTVHSIITVDLDGTERTANVTSELRLIEGKVPIWMIIAASILALIILVILIFILKQCGFLERENKKELKRARMSVRRQTIMRQSMMNRPRSQDLDRLVDNNEASSSQEKKKKDRRVVVKDNK